MLAKSIAKPAPRRSPRLAEARIETRITPRRSPRLATLASDITEPTQATQAQTTVFRRSPRIKHRRQTIQDMKDMHELDSEYVYSESDSDDDYDDYDYEVY